MTSSTGPQSQMLSQDAEIAAQLILASIPKFTVKQPPLPPIFYGPGQLPHFPVFFQLLSCSCACVPHWAWPGTCEGPEHQGSGLLGEGRAAQHFQMFAF